jgi:HD superfamily phosphodiesterase
MSARAKLQTYLADERIKKIHDSVQTAFESRNFIAHNWDHIYRDTINAIRIGEAEGADMQIVLPAILLHDVGFLYNPDPAVHHIIGAEKCADRLGDWSAAERQKIADCILSHKGSMPGFEVEPPSLEARVVHDADLLEKTGKIGILQVVRTDVEFGQGGLANHQDYKNLYAIVKKRAGFKNLTFYTKTGEEIAARRGGHQIRREFFQDLLAELEEYES